jgi:hypothetical protein
LLSKAKAMPGPTNYPAVTLRTMPIQSTIRQMVQLRQTHHATQRAYEQRDHFDTVNAIDLDIL